MCTAVQPAAHPIWWPKPSITCISDMGKEKTQLVRLERINIATQTEQMSKSSWHDYILSLFDLHDTFVVHLFLFVCSLRFVLISILCSEPQSNRTPGVKLKNVAVSLCLLIYMKVIHHHYSTCAVWARSNLKWISQQGNLHRNNFVVEYSSTSPGYHQNID